MKTFRLQIVTPEGSLFDGEAESIRLRTTEGYVSILAGHTDYIAALDIGKVTVTQNGTARDAACGGGFLSVQKGEVRLAATTFEYAEDIDVQRNEAKVAEMEQFLSTATEPKDIQLAKAKLARAKNRLSIVSK